MKFCISVVRNRDRQRVIDELTRAGFKFTIIGSTGGFLREGNSTFMIGCEDGEVQALREVFKTHCKAREQVVTIAPAEAGPVGGIVPSPMEVPVGGGVMFVMTVDEYDRF